MTTSNWRGNGESSTSILAPLGPNPEQRRGDEDLPEWPFGGTLAAGATSARCRPTCGRMDRRALARLPVLVLWTAKSASFLHGFVITYVTGKPGMISLGSGRDRSSHAGPWVELDSGATQLLNGEAGAETYATRCGKGLLRPSAR